MIAVASRKNPLPVFEPIELHITIETVRERDLLYRALSHFQHRHAKLPSNQDSLSHILDALSAFGATTGHLA